MFTGITQATTTIEAVTQKPQLSVVRFKTPKGWKLVEGQSVSVDGICSTVLPKGKSFEVEYMHETLDKTTAGNFAKGAVVNLERSTTPTSLLDGHIVQGHVDATAKVAAVRVEGEIHDIAILLPKELAPYVVQHGSLALNGVSLTVASLKGSNCTVALIPHTLEHTNLGALKKGGRVNVEVDVLARYLHKALRAMVSSDGKRRK